MHEEFANDKTQNISYLPLALPKLTFFISEKYALLSTSFPHVKAGDFPSSIARFTTCLFPL